MNRPYHTTSFIPEFGVSIGPRRADPEFWKPKVLIDTFDPGLDPVLEALRLWTGNGDPPATDVYFSHAPAPPDIVLLCGFPLQGAETLMDRVAELRRSATLIIWLVPPGVELSTDRLRDRSGVSQQLMSAVDATVLVNGLPVPGSSQELGDVWAVTRAARGLLHQILFDGLVCIDLADIKTVLLGSDRSPLLHFSISSQLAAPPKAWWPAECVFRKVTEVMISTIMPDQKNMLLNFDDFAKAMLNQIDENATCLASCGIKKMGTHFEAEVYVRFSLRAFTV